MSTALADLHAEIAGCVRCPLAAGRTTVVVGSGPPDARLMLVGEAPGFHEDRSGVPFVGAAGQLLDRLLGEVGLQRSEVFVANVLKCRPPGNRDPEPAEIESCRPYLERQVELVAPLVIGSLGNFATRLLSGRQVGITRVHGSPLRITVGAHRTVLYPLYHPAAALRTPAMLAALREDLARLPELFERAARAAARATEGADDPGDDGAGSTPAVEPEPAPEVARVYAGTLPGAQPAQLGLF